MYIEVWIPLNIHLNVNLTDFTAVCAAQDPQDGKKHVFQVYITIYFMHIEMILKLFKASFNFFKQ